MKYTVLFIVSCYIGLTYEYIAPQGLTKNDNSKPQTTYNSTRPNILNITNPKVFQKINSSSSFLQNAFERDLYASSQPKSSEIHERAFIYMKSIKPIHNKLYLSQIRNDPKDGRHNIHEDKLSGDIQDKLVAGQRKKECAQLKDEDDTNSLIGFDCEPHRMGTKASLKSDLNKRDFLELLKMPLLRLVSKNTEEQRKSHKLNTKIKDKDTKTHKGLPFDLQNKVNDESRLSASGEVEKILDQFVNESFESTNQKPKTANKGKPDCNIQETHRNMCKCKMGSFDTENTFYSNDDII
ncbi:uncharacterized protein LOC123689304 [Pieris rapae]|uniref:uncharacterized protein LOC123689304 n=1 Tax=Pieris rapae TaxID=64459 RepID=UPI001E27B4A8|nr:uncharacterized protein LOC123689304 [Pieris rapae]